MSPPDSEIISPLIGLLNVLGDFNREGLGIEADFLPAYLPGHRSLNQIVEWRGKPIMIVIISRFGGYLCHAR